MLNHFRIPLNTTFCHFDSACPAVKSTNSNQVYHLPLTKSSNLNHMTQECWDYSKRKNQSQRYFSGTI